MPCPSTDLSSSPNSYHQHILAINNDPAVLALFRDVLQEVQEAGYQVSLHASVDHDLTQINALNPDLIVLDSMWAHEDDSWSLLQMVRMDPATTNIPIVLCTGAVREVEALAPHVLEMGITVVRKPFTIDQLIDAIRERLAPEHPPIVASS